MLEFHSKDRKSYNKENVGSCRSSYEYLSKSWNINARSSRSDMTNDKLVKEEQQGGRATATTTATSAAAASAAATAIAATTAATAIAATLAATTAAATTAARAVARAVAKAAARRAVTAAAVETTTVAETTCVKKGRNHKNSPKYRFFIPSTSIYNLTFKKFN